MSAYLERRMQNFKLSVINVFISKNQKEKEQKAKEFN
jgi:hypothetical protein